MDGILALLIMLAYPIIIIIKKNHGHKEYMLDQQYPLIYIKKLEAYLDSTRKQVLVYDACNKDPEMAVMVLEAMRKNLYELSKELLNATDAERIIISEIVREFRRRG